LGLGEDSGVEELREVSVTGEASSAEAGPVVNARLRSGSGRAAGIDYQKLDAALRYADSVATIESLEVVAYQGTIRGKGRYDMSNSESPRFDLDATLRGVRAQALGVSLFGPTGGVLEGTIDTDLQLAGQGNTAEAIRRSLTGTTRIEVFEGLVRDVNLAETALQSLTGVPGLSGAISPKVRAKHPSVFSTGDTVFDTLRAVFEVKDGRLPIKDMNLSARDYGMTAAGSIGLDGSMDVQGTLSTSRELAQSLVGESKTVRYITGPSGRIDVPLSIRGPMTSPKVQPDITELTRRAAQNAASTALGDLLDKKLGTSKKETESSTPSETPPPQNGATDPPKESPPPPVDPLEDLIRRGLEDLL